MPSNLLTRVAIVGVSAGVVALTSAVGAQAAGTKMRDNTARAALTTAGITISSSGQCGNRNNSKCTSLEQINSGTVAGIISLKRASKCAVTITGGTEVGHASGVYSHWNGYKLDVRPNACLSQYVKNNFTSIGGNKWRAASGNIYWLEGSHWDIVYY